MAAEEEEAEYESDPEDALLSLSRRRREASDDEDGEGSEVGGKSPRKNLRAGIGYDGDPNWQGGGTEYEDEESGVEEEEEDEEEELEEEVAVMEERASDRGGYAEKTMGLPTSDIDGQIWGGEPVVYQGKNLAEVVEEENKKNEKEPYAVPTAGAFYMHDDRFQEENKKNEKEPYAVPRCVPSERKLWESKDDRAWVHDRFEEMILQDALYDEGRRTSKGRLRARGTGKTRGSNWGYGRGNKYRGYYDHGNNQNRAPKFVRGRGPIRYRYEPVPKNKSVVLETQHKQSAKPQERTSNNTVGRQSYQTSSIQPDLMLSRKHVFASSLNSASPPFYPSGSSSQNASVTQKRDVQAGSTNKALSSSMHTEVNFPASQSGSFLRGKVIVNSVGHGGQYIDASLPLGKNLVYQKVQSSRSAMSLRRTTPSYSGILGRGLITTALPNYQQASALNQVTSVSSLIQPPVVQERLAPTVIQSALRSSTQQLGQRPGSGYQASYSPRSPSTNSSEVGETDSPSGTSKSKTLLVGKGKTSNQVSRGTVLYNGAQVIGGAAAVGVSHGDQSFPATPALLPVMQFAGQNHDGLGVTAVGMPLPGYVAQSQLGFGNSEMTWMPMLAGASGALGASYCSPYIALDNSYYAHPSGKTSSSVPSNREIITTKPATMWKPPQRLEIVYDEFGQRQNKPRRYSEMNFGQ